MNASKIFLYVMAMIGNFSIWLFGFILWAGSIPNSIRESVANVILILLFVLLAATIGAIDEDIHQRKKNRRKKYFHVSTERRR